MTCRPLAVPALALVLIGLSAIQPLSAGETRELRSYPKPPPLDTDEAALKRRGVDVAPAALLELVRQQTHAEPIDPKRLAALIADLGDDRFEQRERASAGLVAAGRSALPGLQAALDSPDPEVQRRARRCVADITGTQDRPLALAALRVLVRRRAAGAVAAVLAYLPEVEGDAEDELLRGLAALSGGGAGPDPALHTALTDPVAARRAAAALLLPGLGGEERLRVRNALEDPSPLVRLRAAQGLLGVEDAAGVPALLGLLDTPDLYVAWQAEELLVWLAGPVHPPALLAAPIAERRQRRREWEAWWRERGKVDWPRVRADHRRPGLVLICDGDRVWLSGCDGKARFRLEGVGEPVDATLLPGGRILVADAGKQAVSERDLSGKVLRERPFTNGESVQGCQRLPDGSTLVVTDEYLLLLDAEGQEAWRYQPPNGEMLTDAVLIGPQRVAALLDSGIVELDLHGGAVVGYLPGGKGWATDGKLAALPGGQYLLAESTQGRLVRIDRAGKVQQPLPVAGVVAADVMHNGHYLASLNPGEGRIAELTPDGRVVWEAYADMLPGRARVCLPSVRIGLDRPRPEDFTLDCVPYRVACLKDRDVVVRQRAATFLAEFGPKAEPAIPPLIASLADEDDDVRHRCAAALAAVGEPSVAPLVRVLREGKGPTRWEAAYGLMILGPTARAAVAPLTAIVADGGADVELRTQCATALGAVGPEAKAAVPTLLTTLKSPEVELRDQSARALGRIGPVQPEVVPALTTALADEAVPVRLGAVHALGQIGSAASAAIPELVRTLRTKEIGPAAPEAVTNLRSAAAAALGNMTTAGGPAALPLADVMRDRTAPPVLRRACITALGKLRQVARPALPAFGELLKDPALPPDLSRVATQTLAALGPDGVPQLAVGVKEGNRQTRIAAIRLLQNLGAVAEPALPALKEAAKDTDPGIAGAAARAAQRIEEAKRMP